MKSIYQADGSLDLVGIEAEAHRLRAEALAGFFRQLFSGLKPSQTSHAKTV